MKILFLSDNFIPETNAPASRTYEHAREWVKKGADVTVITTVPNFPKGKVYEGYKNKIYQKEHIDGIEVIRVISFIAKNEGFILRILDFISFMITSFIASLFQKKIDVIIATSPQFFTALAGFFVSRFKRIPWVFEVRDLWPDTIAGVGFLKDGLIFKLLKRIEYFLYKKADAIIVVTNGFKEILGNNGVDTKKISVVMNGVDLTKFKYKDKPPNLEEKYNLKGKKVLGYIGTHGETQGLQTILLSAAKLKEMKNIIFLFIGQGSRKKELIEFKENNKLDNVIFLDNVPRNEIIDYWALIDISLIILKKREVFRTVIPSKIFESIAMHKPIIIGVEGDAKEIVDENKIGASFEPEDFDDLTSNILNFIKDEEKLNLYKINTEKCKLKYDRTIQACKMLKILEQIK